MLMLMLISQEAITLGLQGFPKLVSRIRLYTAVRLYTAKALAQLCCLEFRAHKVFLTLESIASIPSQLAPPRDGRAHH